MAREYPETNAKVGAFVAPLREHFVSSTRPVLLILLATVTLVLLIACSNLANFLLCRTANRSKEIALRAALGAGPWQLIRQFFAESLLLCLGGGAVGLFLATTTFDFLAHLVPGQMPGLKALAIDWRVLAFTLGIAMATAMVFGLVPLLQVRRIDLNCAMKESSRTLASAPGPRRAQAGADLRRSRTGIHAAGRRGPADTDTRSGARRRYRVPHAEHPDHADRSAADTPQLGADRGVSARSASPSELHSWG